MLDSLRSFLILKAAERLHRHMLVTGRGARISIDPLGLEGPSSHAPCCLIVCSELPRNDRASDFGSQGKAIKWVASPAALGGESVQITVVFIHHCNSHALSLILLPKCLGLGKENTPGQNIIKTWNYSEDQVCCISNTKKMRKLT